MSDFLPIETARFVEDGTIADLEMPGGAVRRAVWMEQACLAAWWPCVPDKRRKPIALYEPTRWRPINRPAPTADIIIMPIVRVERHDDTDDVA